MSLEPIFALQSTIIFQKRGKDSLQDSHLIIELPNAHACTSAECTCVYVCPAVQPFPLRTSEHSDSHGNWTRKIATYCDGVQFKNNDLRIKSS